jgi:hypothetical protein
MDGDLALKYLDATPKCPRTETIEKSSGRGVMGSKSKVEVMCGAVLSWKHGVNGFGSWWCGVHGLIDEARPVQPLRGDSREGLSAA